MTKIFYFYRFDDGFWFRLFGYGLTVMPASSRKLFSERNGHRRFLYVGKWKIGVLKP